MDLNFDLREYKDFIYSDYIDLSKYKKVEKLEDLFNNFNPLIISEDPETQTCLIRRTMDFAGTESYIYRLIKSDGMATDPILLFSSQYQCRVWNSHIIDLVNEKIIKESAKNTFRFLAGLINYSQYKKRQEEIGDDSDIRFYLN